MDLRELPSGWAWTKVDEISELIRGVSYPKEESSNEPKEGLIPILRANNIQGELNYIDLVYVPLKRVNQHQFVRELDIVIAMSSGSKDLVGKTAQAKIDFNGAFGTFCGLLRVNLLLNRKYVGFYFQSRDYRDSISKASSGVNINNLRRNDIEYLDIPLPPLPEQQRIVAKIEELFTKLDAGVETLKKIRLQLKRYRQSVLKSAFEGRLTAEWREAHKNELEPASVLLEKIKAERKKSGKYKELPPPNTADLPELPEGWGWGQISDYGENEKYAIVDGPFGSSLKVSDYVNDGEIPVISISNIDEGFDKNKLRYITKAKFETIKRSAVKPGDIIVAKIGSSYGKTGYYPEWMPVGVIPANLLKITVSKTFHKQFVLYFLKSSYFKNQLDSIMKSTAQPAFNVTMFRLLAIPFPPVLEQQHIIEEIERCFSVADSIEKTIEHSLEQAERLRQSILKQAFEGKLVPQDPSDEPAEKLLERIKAEKAKTQTNTKRRRAVSGK